MFLVSTPNGKVGTHVAQQLIAQGLPVRIGAHTVEKARQAFQGAEVVALNLFDPESAAAALEGVSALYLASPGDAPAAPITAVVDRARAAGVQRVVQLSASGVEQGDSPLRQIERHIEASGMSWTFLRPNWFMQNYSTQHQHTIKAQGAFYEPADEGATAFIDARDIAAVAVAALTQDGHAGQAYTLTGGRAYTRHEVAATLSQALGREIRYVPQDDAQFRETMAAFMPQDYIEMLSSLYGMVRAGWTAAVSPEVERLLGRAPISLAQFARDERNAWA
ncbi:SDR family oxidoreductase [Candidatus Gracilibacteria bacterium]|nr:SDR family oxidoreductase [Candidatus Gracilibacteria bacterium]